MSVRRGRLGATSMLVPPRPACHWRPLPTHFTRRLPKLDFISVSKRRVYEHVSDNNLVQPGAWTSPHLDTESTHTHNQTWPWAPDATQETRRQVATRQVLCGARLGPTGSRARQTPCWQPPSVQRAKGDPRSLRQPHRKQGQPPRGWSPGPRTPAVGGRHGAGLAAHMLIFPGLRLKKKTFSVPTRFKASIS